MDDESTWSMATLASELISLSRTQADRRNNPLLVLQEAVDKVERFKSSPRAYSFLGRSSIKTPSSPLYLQETTPSTTAALTPTSPSVTSPWKYQAPTGYDSCDSDDDCMLGPGHKYRYFEDKDAAESDRDGGTASEDDGGKRSPTSIRFTMPDKTVFLNLAGEVETMSSSAALQRINAMKKTSPYKQTTFASSSDVAAAAAIPTTATATASPGVVSMRGSSTGVPRRLSPEEVIAEKMLLALEHAFDEDMTHEIQESHACFEEQIQTAIQQRDRNNNSNIVSHPGAADSGGDGGAFSKKQQRQYYQELNQLMQTQQATLHRQLQQLGEQHKQGVAIQSQQLQAHLTLQEVKRKEEDERLRAMEAAARVREEQERAKEESRVKAEKAAAAEQEKKAALEAESAKQAAAAKEKGEIAAQQQQRVKDQQQTVVAVAANAGEMKPEAAARLAALSEVEAKCAPLVQSQDPAHKRLRLQIRSELNQVVQQMSATMSQVNKLALKVKVLMTQVEKMEGGKESMYYLYMLDQLAAKIVDSGYTRIRLHPATAFPMAYFTYHVVSGEPLFLPLLLAHFHKKCIYSIPHYLRRNQFASDSEYFVALGMGEDSEQPNGFETEADYFERMKGYIFLLSAFMQIPRPDHPFGLDAAWTWLARLLNQKPRSVTSTVLLAFLQQAGYQMLLTYPKQFPKVLHFIARVFVPMLPENTSERRGAKIQLQIWLEKYLKSGHIDEAEGRVLAQTQDSSATRETITAADQQASS